MHSDTFQSRAGTIVGFVAIATSPVRSVTRLLFLLRRKSGRVKSWESLQICKQLLTPVLIACKNLIPTVGKWTLSSIYIVLKVVRTFKKLFYFLHMFKLKNFTVIIFILYTFYMCTRRLRFYLLCFRCNFLLPKISKFCNFPKN